MYPDESITTGKKVDPPPTAPYICDTTEPVMLRGPVIDAVPDDDDVDVIEASILLRIVVIISKLLLIVVIPELIVTRLLFTVSNL